MLLISPEHMHIRNIFAATIPPSRLAAAHLPLHKGGFGAVRIAMLNYNLPTLVLNVLYLQTDVPVNAIDFVGLL